MHANENLGYNIDKSAQPDADVKKKMQRFEELAGLNLKREHENCTILLDIMRYSGKDFNLVEAFDLFVDCHNNEKYPKHEHVGKSVLRAWFLKALAELKYAGFVSATRTSTFLFKKNFFSKPQHTLT